MDRHDNPSVVQIRLKQSKTDPFRHGVDIFLGATNAELCPVSAILAYVAARPRGSDPLFQFKDFPNQRQTSCCSLPSTTACWHEC